VLAGGRGSRFGGEGKPTVELARRPLLAYVLDAITGALDDVAVAAKASTALPGSSDGETLAVPGTPRVALWTEPDEPHHPLAGLRYALRRAGGRPVLACAVDMPLVTAPLVAEMPAPTRTAPSPSCRSPAIACSPCWRATSQGRSRCSRRRARTLR
jgi:molybdenum cofactor guanylyltransferase